jgi:phosphinothricin acetyltransferase
VPDPIIIRPAGIGDLAAINAIYNHYVLTCTCTWQVQPDSDQTRRAWFDSHGPAHPVLVAQDGGEVVGWGSLSPFAQREGWRHTVEDSLYVRPDCQGRGVGSRMLGELIARARALGHRSIVAVISADQKPSIALHGRLGFVERGRLLHAGRKFGTWLDAVYMQWLDSQAD